MELVINNYGAIKECSIDLSRKLYLFIGYNNTGKTYLTKLIYEIFNKETLNNFANSEYNKLKLKDNDSKITLTKAMIDKILGNYSAYLKDVIVKKILKIDSGDDFSITFKYDIADLKKEELKSTARIAVAESLAELENKPTDVEIYNLSKTKDSLDINFEHKRFDDIYSELPLDFFDTIPKKQFEKQVNSIKDDVSKTIVNSLLNLLLQNKERSFFLPSNRIFILENTDALRKQEESRRKELSEALIDFFESKREKKLIGEILAKKSESEYPSYISNLINKITNLRSNKDNDFLVNGTGYYNDLLLKFNEILGGDIVYEKPTSVSNYTESFKLSENDLSIKMDLASSSVNQLSTLFLFLKYWAKSDGNFLMIDEPEENLHPENQVQLVHLLLEFLVNNRLLITTHSPLISEIINNYLVLNQLNDRSNIIKDFGLIDVDISPMNTGIYYFNGERVIEHKADNYGTIFTSFKLAQEKVYGLAEKLNDLMFHQLSEM